MTSRTLALLLPALALGLAAGCEPEIATVPSSKADDDAPGGDADAPEPDADEPGADEPDADDPDAEPEPTSEDEDATGYAIRGRTGMASGDAASIDPDALVNATQTTAYEGCPFDELSEPCNAEACWDDASSPDCKDIIENYCQNHPEDPGCGGDGTAPDGGAPGDGTDPGDGTRPDGTNPDGTVPDDGETWACAEDPTWPPCEVCLDPEATDDDCGTAWHQHCLEHPDDVWCDDGDEPVGVYQPTSLKVLVHQVEFSLDAEGCTDPILVGESDEPRYVDFADGPELVEAVLPPDGVYPCVIITMSDHIQWSVDEESPCAGEHVQDVFGDDGTEETVRLHLSSGGHAGRDGSAAFEPPGLYLGGPLEVGPGIVASDFVITFPDGVWYRPDRDRECEIQKPEFAFETYYE